MDALVTNLLTRGNELKKKDGSVYVGRYHILEDGTIMSGVSPQQKQPVPEILIPMGFMPVGTLGELISKYKENSSTTINSESEFEGEYATLTIKSYKNDIDIYEEVTTINKAEPKITLQPDLFFRRNTSIDYTPGTEIFIDESRNIQIMKGKSITLDFNFISEDMPDKITFKWYDSFERLISTGKPLIIDTANSNWESETFYCVVEDSYGQDTTNDITITIIDPKTSPIFYKNILKNGSAVSGLSDWESVGDSPEEIGTFLVNFENSKHPFGLETVGIPFIYPSAPYGSIFYHKYVSSTSTNPSDFDTNAPGPMA